MEKLAKNDSKKIVGGGISFTAGAIIIGAIVFVSGILDGFFRPFGCHK